VKPEPVAPLATAAPVKASAYLREHPAGCSLAVRVQPGARQTAITGVYGEGNRPHLNIAVKAPPIEGRANEVLIAWLSKALSIARSRITVIHGEHDRFKLLVLSGMSVAEAQAILQAEL
jgi:uncharacterized protein (TIGR00251 family)